MFGDGECESCLARSARAGESHEPDVLATQDRLDRRQLEPAADERGRRRRQPEPRRFRRRLECERRIVPQHRALELAQRRARLDSELVEHAASVLVGVERVLLAPGAIQRKHELLAEPLAIRLGGHERFQLGHDLAVLAEREPRVGAQLERLQAQILERHRGGAHRAVAEIGERVTAPERKRTGEQLVGVSRRAACERVARVGEVPFEPRDVQLLRLDADTVGVAPGLEPVGADRATQPVDVHLKGADRARRRPVAPERVDEPLARDRRAAPEEELRQKRPLLRAAQCDRAALADHLDRPQQPKFHPTLPRSASLKRILSGSLDGDHRPLRHQKGDPHDSRRRQHP